MLDDGRRLHVDDVFSRGDELEAIFTLGNGHVLEHEPASARMRHRARVAQETFDEQRVVARVVLQRGEQRRDGDGFGHLVVAQRLAPVRPA